MKSFRNLLLAFVLLGSNSCFNANQVAVSSRNFEDVIDLTQNLVFTFNKNLVPKDDIGEWFSGNYIEIVPAVEGKFKWTAENELTFSPAEGFAPTTNYKAVLSKDLLEKADKKLSVSGKAIAFHTPYPSIKNATTYWAKSKADGKAFPKVKLTFNYPVSTTEVAKHLSVQADDQELKPQVAQTPNDSTVIVSLPNTDLKENDDLAIAVSEGLKVNNFTTEKNLETTVEVASKSLEVQEVEAVFENNEGYIRVTTSQELKAETTKNFVIVKKMDGDNATPMTVRIETMENGFLINGAFNESESYELVIKKGLESSIGTKLESDYEETVTFGKMPVSIAFSNRKAIYLSSKGNKNVGVSIVGVPEVQLKIAKLFENNILHYLNNYRYSDYYEDEDGSSSRGYSYSQDSEETLSDVIVDKKIKTSSLPKSSGVSALNLNFDDPSRFKGVFLVTIHGDDNYYERDTRIVSISDIGLIAKQGPDQLMVFTNSIQTTDALKNVEISLISANNQVITTLVSDDKGVVVFDNLKEILGRFKVAMIVAKQGDDFNYMAFEGTKVETSRYEVEGKRDHVSGFDAFVYGDRNIYRPGETLHFNTILRKENWQSVGEIPVKLKLLMPNGREYFAAKKTSNSQGAIDISIPTEKNAVTGVYVFEVYNGNDVLLASKNVNVEEFMPDRIKVDVKTDKEFYETNNNIQLSATATNMFGPPAANRNYEIEMKLSKAVFAPKAYRNYSFEMSKTETFESELREGKTDAKGLAEKDFFIPETYDDMGVLEAKLYVTVFDESSRPVNRLKKLKIYTQKTFLGINMADSYVGTKSPVKINFVALNKDEKPVSANTKIEIVKYEYQTLIEKSDGTYKYVSKRLPKVMLTKTLTLNGGNGNLSYTPAQSGEYEVKIYNSDSETYNSMGFYAYQWGYTDNSAFEVNNEGSVDIAFDKESYQVGDKAKILLKAPFAGKMLVTIERNKILEHYFVSTDKKSAEIEVNLNDFHLPNFYVSATLFRSMDTKNSLPLTVAHGYASANVEKPSTKIPLEIVAVEKSRSSTKQRITVKTGIPNAQVTVAAVDEGILQVKNFISPDAYKHFYQKRALEVDSYDVYPFLFPEMEAINASSVGGDGYNLEKRINPLSNGRVELVALWSGILQTDGNGEAFFDVNIPQFSGDLRIMATAYQDESFGSASKNMLVADPIVLNSALPRFLSPADEISVPVTLHNTTKQPASVTVTANLTGDLELVSGANQTLNIPAEREATAQFTIKAKQVIGNGTVTIVATGMGEKFSNKTSITIRPASSLVKKSSSGVITTAKTEVVNFGGNFLPNTLQSKLLVSHSPLVQFSKNMQDLVEYPHGCLEQTTSQAFPQLYLADLTKLMRRNLSKKSTNESNENIQSAIKRIETMQTHTGGLSLWQGGHEDYWWGTAYATHFLLEAQKAGFEVSSGLLKKSLDYLSNQVNTDKAFENYAYYKGNTKMVKKIIKQEVIYSLYVLSLAKKPNRPLMNLYKGKPEQLLHSERYLLASAFNQIGDAKGYNELLPKQFEENGGRETGENLSSPIRNLALSLNTLIDTDPNNLQVPAMARQLTQAMKASSYLNTQETSFAMLALGKFAKKFEKSDMIASVKAGDKILGSFTNLDLKLNIGSGKSAEIVTTGTGNLYYFAETEGIGTAPVGIGEDKGLKVRRTFMTREGLPLKTADFKQNQLIVVKVTLESVNNLPVKNVVVTDLLPAGLEIENPRISPERELDWIKNQSNPDYFDIRDDRINFFTNVESPRNFYYLVRAVTKGKFVLGHVSADAMYNADFRSYNGAGVCSVK